MSDMRVGHGPVRGFERLPERETKAEGRAVPAENVVAGEAGRRMEALGEIAPEVAARFKEKMAERGAMPQVPPLSSEPSWGSTGWGQGALDSACAEVLKLQQELEKLGSSPEAMAKSMSLQFKMQNVQQVITAVTKIREMAHESVMRTFR